MKIGRLIKLSAIAVGFTFLNGCSSCNEAPSSNSNSANSNTVVVTPKRATNAAPVSNGNANAKLKPYPGTKPGENPTLDNSKVKVIDTSKPTSGPPRRKGPDNSEMWTIMNSKGEVIETRRFLNNAQLEKIERLTKTPKDVTVKVYLRNGKVVELADGKIKNYKIDNANQILTAAGVKIEVKTDPNAPTKEEIMKKRPIVKKPVSK